MNIWNIILKQQKKDSFDFEVPPSEKKLIIDTWQNDKETSFLRSKVFNEFKRHNLVPHTNVIDLIHLAMGVYTTDQVVSRSVHGFQGWSRHFRLYIPVSSLKEWNPLQEKVENLLSFLSGDKWEIYFRGKDIKENKQLELPSDSNPYGIQKVSLFSGGLDSFIGAIDLLERKQKVAFVSHYKRGSEGSVQTKLYSELKKIYGKDSFIDHQFWVQPNQRNKNASKESSSRARSFLFMCLGISVANSLGDNIDFNIPENGLISLNIPLTGTRLGSHSTRTTHPYYLKIFKEIVTALGIRNNISNPYQFKTKGQMMIECKGQSILKQLESKTLSCSHSENSRYAGLSPGLHCGYCVPCIIRQAAEKRSNIKGTKYVNSILKSPPSPNLQSGSDVRAFRLALERMKRKPKHSILFDILSSGPIPFEDDEEFAMYIDIYKRGMKEVEVFLKK